jgi:NAD(P)-dependent dehydrogenase (short-subunit alcohol dehydrogenase family)
MNEVRFNFEGRNVLVTGGTSGIGAAIANAYADAGASVTITGTRASSADYEADLSRFGYLQLDLEDNASIDAVAAAIPACDILVNNAGASFYPLGLDEHDPDVFARAVQVHLVSAFRLSRRLVDRLAASTMPGGGPASATAWWMRPIWSAVSERGRDIGPRGREGTGKGCAGPCARSSKLAAVRS